MSIVDDLVALGETPEQVAETLKEQGIIGYRQHASSCPIYHYLKSKGYPVDCLSQHSICLLSPYYGDIEMPEVVGRFIVAFDQGKYPELIKE
jgi:hypothetical protein